LGKNANQRNVFESGAAAYSLKVFFDDSKEELT
jgi:hypothetical protein